MRKSLMSVVFGALVVVASWQLLPPAAEAG